MKSNNKKLFFLLIWLFLFFEMTGPLFASRDTTDDGQPVIRVLLGSSHGSVSVLFPSGGEVLNSRNRRIQRLGRTETFNWNPGSGRRGSNLYEGETLTFVSRDRPLEFNGRAYRGKLEISFDSSKAVVVNHVGLEDYLRGVVGSEIGSLSHIEALRTQAVIARTYAWASRNKHQRNNADVCSTTHCQVYNGVAAERNTLDPAIFSTRGIILVSSGSPVETLYHATCGGMTSNNEDVFGGSPRPYLRRVSCPFCSKGHNYRWSRSLTTDSIRTALARENIRFTLLHDVDYTSPSRLDRVEQVIFHTSEGTFSVRGTVFRRLFNLPSTTFTVVNRRDIRRLLSVAQKNRKQPGYGVVTSALGGIEEEGPAQLFLSTSMGLRRVVKPKEGWTAVFWGALESQEKTTDNGLLAGRISSVIDGTVEIYGRGFGHQTGLCQAGAIAMANRGWSYRQILAYYYQNSALHSLDY